MGSMYEAEAEKLLREQVQAAVLKAPDNACLIEIGVYQGNTAHILDEERSGLDLYLVDDFSLEGVDRAKWPQARDGVLWWCDATELAQRLRQPITVLHQDADHSRDVVAEHLRLFGRHVMPGGIIALHDYHGGSYPGVRRAWERWADAEEFHCGGRAGSLQIWVRD